MVAARGFIVLVANIDESSEKTNKEQVQYIRHTLRHEVDGVGQQLIFLSIHLLCIHVVSQTQFIIAIVAMMTAARHN